MSRFSIGILSAQRLCSVNLTIVATRHADFLNSENPNAEFFDSYFAKS